MGTKGSWAQGRTGSEPPSRGAGEDAAGRAWEISSRKTNTTHLSILQPVRGWGGRASRPPPPPARPPAASVPRRVCACFARPEPGAFGSAKWSLGFPLPSSVGGGHFPRHDCTPFGPHPSATCPRSVVQSPRPRHRTPCPSLGRPIGCR